MCPSFFSSSRDGTDVLEMVFKIPSRSSIFIWFSKISDHLDNKTMDKSTYPPTDGRAGPWTNWPKTSYEDAGSHLKNDTE